MKQIWLCEAIKDYLGSVMRVIGSTRIELGRQCKRVPLSHTMHLCVHQKRARSWNGTMQAATTKNCIPVSKWMGTGRQAGRSQTLTLPAHAGDLMEWRISKNGS